MKHAPRKYQRIYLTFYLRIFEGNTFLGFIIDISKDGMMVMSEFPLEEGRNYALRMKIPSSMEWEGKRGEDRFIEFGGSCKWSRRDEEVEKEFYISGFQFSDLGEEANRIIHRMIEEYRIP